MARPKKSSTTPLKKSNLRPAMTPEGKENQLISLATDLAAQQLMDGTASSQVITHFLKLGTTKAKLEKEKLQNENELLKAKTEAIESQKRVEELYSNALNAMKRYSGMEEDEEIFDDYDEEEDY